MAPAEGRISFVGGAVRPMHLRVSHGLMDLLDLVDAVRFPRHNLGIPFNQLKTKMVGPPSESLGKAIHTLKPDAKSNDETKKAEKQAKQDIDDSKAS
jgi:hypothetical protein